MSANICSSYIQFESGQITFCSLKSVPTIISSSPLRSVKIRENQLKFIIIHNLLNSVPVRMSAKIRSCPLKSVRAKISSIPLQLVKIRENQLTFAKISYNLLNTVPVR